MNKPLYSTPNSSVSTRAKDWFKDDDAEKALSEMLDAAEERAKDGWEAELVDDFQFKISRWGLETYMSENQYNKLKQIASRDA